MKQKPGAGRRALATVPPGAAFLALCLLPCVYRLRSPSLYADDVDRLTQLRTGHFPGTLLVPFNEHLAPLFQVVSWGTWVASGCRLTRAPLAFTLASLLPFALTMGVLGAVLRRETRSTAAALAGLAVFCLNPLALETVFWYSASSFMWALLATLVAWGAAAESATEGGSGRFGWLAAVSAAASPAFSAVGLLAGPLAVVRALAAGGPRARRAALAPLAGTAVYLAGCAAFHDRTAVAVQLAEKAGLVPGLVVATRAPFAALVPSLFGRGPFPTSGLAGLLEASATAAATAALAVRARRAADRPLIVGGITLILGGYALTCCARAGAPAQPLLGTQRYHLFPLLGLVFLLAGAVARARRWFDARPAATLYAAAALAAVLFARNHVEIRGRARFLRFPDQAATLAAVDRLGAVCAREHVTRAQALAALDPVERAWAPAGRSPLVLLGPGAPTPGLPDRLVKARLLAGLSEDDRRSVCGGMDVTAWMSPPGCRLGAGAALAVGRPVSRSRVRDLGGGRLVAGGWPAFVEFAFPEGERAGARALDLSGSAARGAVAVWWRGEGARWSEARSVRFRPVPGRDWVLPLHALPHFDAREARRVRLHFHAPGEVRAAAPRLLR